MYSPACTRFWSVLGVCIIVFSPQTCSFPPPLLDVCRFLSTCLLRISCFFPVFVSFTFLRRSLVVCLLCSVFCLCVYLIIVFGWFFDTFCNVDNMFRALVSMLYFASLFVFLFFLCPNTFNWTAYRSFVLDHSPCHSLVTTTVPVVFLRFSTRIMHPKTCLFEHFEPFFSCFFYAPRDNTPNSTHP